MLPYKTIEIESYDEIRIQLIELLFDTTKEITTTSFVLDKQTVFNKVPKLQEFISNNNLEWDIGRYFTRTSFNQGPIHIDGNDSYPKFLALNLPLFGCSGSYMQWWSNVDVVATSTTQSYGENIKVYDGPNKVVTHSLELVSPCLVRIDIPHNAINVQNKPRAIFSIRFNPQPLHLWY